MSEIHFKYPIFFKEELIMSTIKKMLLVVTACVFVLALAACGPDKNNTTTTTPTPTTVAAATATPTPVPDRDLKGLAVVVGDWWSGDDWQFPTSSTADELNSEYQHEMMKKYNYTITRKTICGWGDQAETCLLSITSNEPLADVMTFDYRFIGAFMDQEDPLFSDVATLKEFDFTDSKWNKAVVDSMTVGNSIYGFATGIEPRTGIFYNKDLVKKLLGESEVDKPYDWQASGEWTWDKFKEFAKKLTVDSDNDGQTDIYGLITQQSVFFEMTMLSNGHAIVTKSADGSKFVNNATNSEVIEDCNWAYSFYTEGLTRRAIEGENWDFFEAVFKEQKAVMIPYDEYKAGDFSADLKDDAGNVIGRAYDFIYGFVCFPKGPKASNYIPVARENIMVIPNCEVTKAKLADIAFAYNIFTDKSPEIKDDPNAWKGAYEAIFRDERSVNETLDIMINKITPVMNPSYIIPGLWDNSTGVIQTKFFYNCDSPDQTPGQLLESLNSEIQTLIDEFNTRRAK